MKNKIRKYLTLLLLSVSAFGGYAQKEGNVWTFPDRSSINFNDTSNIVVDSSSDGILGGHYPSVENSTLADSAGNLFCYSTGVNWGFNALYVYDRTHNLMPNGSNLQGNGIFASLLLQQPEVDSIIYLFHTGSDAVSNYYFYFSRINKNLNNGLGDVELRNNMIFSGTLSADKIAACKHANGRDWWIFIHDYATGAYPYFLLTPDSISYIGTQILGSVGNDLQVGKLIFSNDGTKLISVGAYGHIDVFDFDRCTGQLSNFRDIGEHLTTEPYQYFSAAFSPGGNVIYVSPYNVVKNFYQWNLNAGTLTDIQNSKILLNQYLDTGIAVNNAYFWHNLAPDGKIYIPVANNYLPGSNGNTYVTQHLDVIEYPDSVGLACHYVRQGFSLGGRRVCGNLPNMAYFGLGADSGSVCDSLPHVGIKEIAQTENLTQVFPNPSSGIFSLRLSDEQDQIISLNVHDIFDRKNVSWNYLSMLDITNEPSGIYFVKVVTRKGKLYFSKLIKQ